VSMGMVYFPHASIEAAMTSGTSEGLQELTR